MDLLEETLHLIYTRKSMSLRELADKAGVKLDWLSLLVNRKIKNPGVLYVIRLNNFLKKVQN